MRDELVPIKGQLSCLLPQPEIDYCTVGPDDFAYSGEFLNGNQVGDKEFMCQHQGFAIMSALPVEKSTGTELCS